MAGARLAIVLAVLCGSSCAAARSTALAEGANPIRKVVTLMQNMQKEIQAEGDKEKELFDKFMCFCQGGEGDLAKSIEMAKATIETTTSKLKSGQGEKSETDQAIVQHKKDKASSEKDLGEATALREKEKAEFEAMAADSKTNIAAVASAIPALEKGLGGAALMQMESADRLGRIFDEYPFSDESDRRTLQAFFQEGSGDYVPQSGQIVGIMKGMKDSMEANLKESEDEEAKAVASYSSLKASKESEIQVAGDAIQSKLKRSGELATSIQDAKDELEDSQTELADSEKFASDLKANCATKEKEWDERCKLREQEITAVSEAISMLNDDDALDLFKKAIPSASLVAVSGTAFLQRSSARAAPAHRAIAILSQGKSDLSVHSPQLNLMLFTLKSKLRRTGATGFEGVTKMIDDMVTLEGKEQSEDDHKKPWCVDELYKADKEEGVEKDEIDDLKAEIDVKADTIATLEEEISTMSEEIKDMDKSVAEATEERKDDHSEYLDSVRMSQVAVELVGKARNRLLKFYNPVLYKAPPKRERTMEEKIIDGGFFAQVRRALRVAPPVAPETFGEYEKSDKSGGVVQLMDNIIKSLNNDIQDAELDEKSAQKGYQDLMTNCQEKRTQLTKSIEDRVATKASMSVKKEQVTEAELADEADVTAIEKHKGNLHYNCDFILENYDIRREARANELEQLKTAKAALAGAKF